MEMHLLHTKDDPAAAAPATPSAADLLRCQSSPSLRYQRRKSRRICHCQISQNLSIEHYLGLFESFHKPVIGQAIHSRTRRYARNPQSAKIPASAFAYPDTRNTGRALPSLWLVEESGCGRPHTPWPSSRFSFAAPCWPARISLSASVTPSIAATVLSRPTPRWRRLVVVKHGTATLLTVRQ